MFCVFSCSDILSVHVVCVFLFILEHTSISEKIACGDGFSTSSSNRCLYTEDKFSHIVGCRSLAHLQDCGETTCNMIKMMNTRDIYYFAQFKDTRLSSSCKHVHVIYTPLHPTFI